MDPKVSKDVSLRKRQKIDSSKRTMFIFVAGAAFILGIALVTSFFLVQQIVFHGKIIGKKNETIGRIERNLENIEKLKDEVRVLDTDSNLEKLRTPGGSAVQVILDALPSEPNSDAFGSSLEKLIASVDGITVESMSVDTVAEGDPGSAEGTEEVDTSGASDTAAPSIGFSVSLRGTSDRLKEILTIFEKSIRVIQLTSIEIQGSDTDEVTMEVNGLVYYQPSRVIELGSEKVMPTNLFGFNSGGGAKK